MPSTQNLVRLSNGQTLLLGPEDKIVKEITIPCESPRCASRRGQDKPVEFTFDDQGTFPEAGDSFISLILPERSPSNPGGPRCFCSPGCVKDYLTYQYMAPGPRQPEVTGELVQKTDNRPGGEFADLQEQYGPPPDPYTVTHQPVVLGQADGYTSGPGCDDFRDPHADMKFVGAGCDDGFWVRKNDNG